MKIREYLTEEKIPSNLKKRLINLIKTPPPFKKSIWIKFNNKDVLIEIGHTSTGRQYFYYDNDLTELTLLLVEICDMFDYKFEQKKLKSNQTFFYIDKLNLDRI